LILGTNNAAQLTITNAGAVGIGTLSPASRLTVLGDIQVGTSGTNGCLKNFSGGLIAGSCSSDGALKAVVGDVTRVLERLTNLQLVRFRWNATAEKIYHDKAGALNTGFIAQSVEVQFPELVSIDTHGYRQLDYTTLILYGLEATKELAARIKSQESEIAALRGQVSQEASNNARLNARLARIEAVLARYSLVVASDLRVTR
jgi:hypothetical protein